MVTMGRTALEVELSRHSALHHRHDVTNKLMDPERYHWKGYAREGLVALQALGSRRGAATRIVVVARPRSGTTLLGDLLAQVPGVADAGEVFRRGKLFPRAYLRHLARTCGQEALLCKVLSGQMLRIAGVRRPVAFLAGLEADGFRFIHLVRETPAQILSLETARESGLWHVGHEPNPSEVELVLDPDRIARRTRVSAMFADFEDRLMAGFPHLRLSYERDLADAAHHQRTIDRICAWAGIDRAPVRARMARTAPRMRIANEPEIRAAIQAAL